MKSFDRREFMRLAGTLVALPVLSRAAVAASYPTKPVHIMVGYGAGGTADVTARLVGQLLSERLGQSFVVENRPGAGSNLGTEAVVRAAPDGYTLLLITGPNAINASLYEKLSFDFIRDVAPVVGIIRVPLVLVVPPSFPAKTIREFVTYAKANPGKVNFATTGNGSPQHVFGALFEMMAGINLTHVPYRTGAQAASALVGGQVDALLAATPVALEHVRSERVRALAVTSAQRIATLPDIPAISEIAPGYEATDWLGFGAPKDTPKQIIATINKTVNDGLTDAKLRNRLLDQGLILGGAPGDFGKLIADETAKWAKVVRAGNIKLD